MKYQNIKNTVGELKKAQSIVGHECTVKEASIALSVTVRAIYYRIKSGKLSQNDEGLIPLDEVARVLKIRELIKEG